MSDAADLPVLADDARPYVRVQATTDPVTPEAVIPHVRRLHRLGHTDPSGLRERLFSMQPPPTIECLIVGAGTTERVSYLFGIDDPAQIDGLERVLRGVFPDTYEYTRVQRTPDRLTAAHTEEARVATVEFQGRGDRPRDWQTQLTPFDAFHTDDGGRTPLAALLETMAASDDTIIYQALLIPKPDWTAQARARSAALAANQDTLGGQLGNVIFGSQPDDVPPAASDRARQEALTDRDTRFSFAVTARIAVVGSTADATARALTTVFAPVSGPTYELRAHVSTGREGERVLEAMRDRTGRPSTLDRVRDWVGADRPARDVIIADASEVASFWLLDGRTLTPTGARSLVPTPGEQTALAHPPAEQLAAYYGPGLTLGQPLTEDGTRDATPIALPPALQPLHVAWFGKTGSGKSTSLIAAMLANHDATDGADILIDPKGDGMATDYLRAHYATYGSLENVRYFDCARTLPAFSFFDIRDELAAGIPRTTAVEDSVDHYLEILTQVMGRDRFEQAVRSPDIIRYLTKALFDPVSGSDAYAHRDLQAAVRTMHERQAAPVVSDPELEHMLAGVVANRARSYDEIMQGVANRIEKIPVDRRLARIFNHVPDTEDPHFDLADALNENVVIILDTGALRTDAQRVLTLVILSNLWTALRRRTARTEGPQPLVNLYIEEAASIAISELLTQLLSKSRGFDCSVTLATQFPAQLREHGAGVYDELLNNVSTFVTGNVPIDQRLAERLATDDMDPQTVGNRLRALRRGQWFCTLPAAFDHPEPRPFLTGSTPPPAGHPAGPQPLTASEEAAFENAKADVETRTLEEAGLTLIDSNRVDTVEADTTATEPAEPEEPAPPRVDSALPYTKRLPPTVAYLTESHALECTECYNRYDPDITGLQRAISCCSSLEETNREDIPICDLNLKLTTEERAASDWTDRQLMFLQAVYNAQQLRYDPLEYDLLSDSMLRLQEYVGIDADAVQDLLDAGLLRHDTDRPHRLYSVSPDGRRAIGEGYREDVDFGHGQGDLEESSEHVLGVELGRRWLIQKYCEAPESPVVEIVPYYERDDHRLDLVGLDETGEIVVAAEVERVNNDLRRGAPDDYDKMAACEVDDAIWIVMSHTEGHEVLAALNDPLDGTPRVEKSYATATPTQSFTIDTPGFTAMYTVTQLRESLDADE